MITTSLYFLVFGTAIGSRMASMGGVGYGSFIVPGLILLSVLTQSIMNASFGIFFPKFTGTIYETLSAPITPLETTLAYVGAAATKDRRRLDGIAKWLEDLRDLQLGSNLDLVEALTESAKRAPATIEPELSRLASRLGHHMPLTDALVQLADELDHPVADTAVASMVFAAGHASGSALQDTFAQLAVTAREELIARDRIDRLRANFERSMRRMLVILAGLLAYMVVVATDTVEPYRSVVGQVWLLIPIGIWASSLVWLRRLSRYERTGRFVTRSALQEAAR